MKRVFTLIIAVIVIFSVSNLALAQGQGKGNGKGLIENRGIQKGNGFTTGQGHLNGNSAVELELTCDIQDVVNQKLLSGEIVDGNYLLIVQQSEDIYYVTSHPFIYSFILYRNDEGVCDALIVHIGHEEE